MNHEKQGTLFWAGLAAYVALCDVFGKETLTHAFGRGLENPRTRPFVVGALGITALHLLKVIPVEADPFYVARELYDRSKDFFNQNQNGVYQESERSE